MTCPAEHAGALLTIDLDAITSNWKFLCGKLAAGCRAAAVVKANAYGLGADRVAPALKAAGCKRFVVATLDEGLALRPLLGGCEILVLNGPLPGCEKEFFAAGLIPVLNSPEQIAGWVDLARREDRRLDAAIHIDTGMSRLGLSRRQAQALDRESLDAIHLMLVMSHLACSDVPLNPMNDRQLVRFREARALFPGVEGSLAASSGIFLGPAWHADWVRPGAALYGIQPNDGAPQPLRPAVRLEARILQVRDIDAGESVGYGATHRAASPGKLATAAAGYADGLFRKLGNQGWGHLEGIRVPMVGRISMDLASFDVTDVPKSQARLGAFIELVGPHITIDEIGKAAGSIGYEILTALGNRYHRRYLGGPAQ